MELEYTQFGHVTFADDSFKSLFSTQLREAVRDNPGQPDAFPPKSPCPEPRLSCGRAPVESSRRGLGNIPARSTSLLQSALGGVFSFEAWRSCF